MTDIQMLLLIITMLESALVSIVLELVFRAYHEEIVAKFDKIRKMCYNICIKVKSLKKHK